MQSLYTATDDKVTKRADAVSMMTIHAAKGLEFAVVFIVGCVDDKLPSYFASTTEQLAEELRLLYVAMTRAKYCLEMTCAPSEQSYSLVKCSRFLENDDVLPMLAEAPPSDEVITGTLATVEHMTTAKLPDDSWAIISNISRKLEQVGFPEGVVFFS